jgi:ankyrin repeat protein
LRAAAFNGHDAVVRLLIEKGAKVGLYGENAVEAAAAGGYLSTVILLLERPLPPEKVSTSPFHEEVSILGSALKIASRRGHSEVVRHLLQQCSERYVLLALEEAFVAHQHEVVRLLLEKLPTIKDYTRYFFNSMQLQREGLNSAQAFMHSQEISKSKTAWYGCTKPILRIP